MTSYRLLNKFVSLAIATILTQGCSNHFVKALAPNTYSINQTTNFFPLEEGYQTSYQINSIYAASESFSYVVGKEISFLGEIATLWIVNNSGSEDTSYIVQNGSALMFYESNNSNPEIVLDFPLTLGKTWYRFGAPDSQIGDTADDGGTNKDSTTGDEGVILASNFPTEGQALMTVDKIEALELSNGSYFSEAVRVSNDAGGNTRNYYWYASGVGLIKYILGGTNSENPIGGVQAELISYGYTH